MFNIPEESLPQCLKDQDRLNVLFAPLRNKSVNSKDWNDKVTTWKSIIKVYCESNNIFSFTLSSLNEIFVRHGRSPPCLNEVIGDMIKNREVEAIEVFFKRAPNTWSGWITDLVIKRPINWSLDTVKKTMFASTNGNYVHLEAVKNCSNKLFKSIPDNYKNKVISLKQLLSALDQHQTPSIENIKLLLHYLEKQQLISVKALSHQDETNEQDTLLLKVVDGKVTTPISETEVGIFTLEQNEMLISKHVESLEEEIDKCVDEAKEHLKRKHRRMAKSSLVKKHQLEKQLEKKATALHNVQSCLEQLKGTHTNAHVWEAYKNALDAFNTTYKDTGISEEAVDDTMLKLGEALDTNEDIQTALARAPIDNDADMSELEKELEDLMLADNEDLPPPDDNSGISDELNDTSINLPEVPEGSPEVAVKQARTSLD